MNLQHEAAANVSAHQILMVIAIASKRTTLPVAEVSPATWEAWDQAVESLDDGRTLQFYRPGAFVNS